VSSTKGIHPQIGGTEKKVAPSHWMGSQVTWVDLFCSMGTLLDYEARIVDAADLHVRYFASGRDLPFATNACATATATTVVGDDAGAREEDTDTTWAQASHVQDYCARYAAVEAARMAARAATRTSPAERAAAAAAVAAAAASSPSSSSSPSPSSSSSKTAADANALRSQLQQSLERARCLGYGHDEARAIEVARL